MALTNGGTISVAGGGVLAFADSSTFPSTETLLNDGAIDVGGDVRLLGAQGEIEFFGGQNTFDLTGTGTLTLSDNGANVITGEDGTETLINDAGETLQGAGTIENLAFVNKGPFSPTTRTNLSLRRTRPASRTPERSPWMQEAFSGWSPQLPRRQELTVLQIPVRSTLQTAARYSLGIFPRPPVRKPW